MQKFTENLKSRLSDAPFIGSLYRKFNAVAEVLTKDMVQVYAAQACFYIIVSAVPALMLTVSVLQLIVPSSVSEVTYSVIALLPDKISAPLDMLAADVFSHPTLHLISISALVALWSVSRALYAVGCCVRRIYNAETPEFSIRGLIGSLVYSVILILIFCLCFVFFFISDNLLAYVVTRFEFLSFIESSDTLYLSLVTVALFVVFSLVFTILYAANAPRKPKSKDARPLVSRSFSDNLCGGVFAAAGWLVYTFAYNIYLNYFALGGSLIYGSLGAVVTLIFWMYFCINILLFGAEVNKYFAYRRQNKRSKGE